MRIRNLENATLLQPMRENRPNVSWVVFSDQNRQAHCYDGIHATELGLMVMEAGSYRTDEVCFCGRRAARYYPEQLHTVVSAEILRRRDSVLTVVDQGPRWWW